MESHLKQRRYQYGSEQQTSVKIPKLFLEPHQAQGSSALPLFGPELTSKLSSLSAFPDSTPGCARPGINMVRYFSLAQRQELELQALIYRYMLAGAAVPPELLRPIKRSLLFHDSPPSFLHYSHYQPQSALLQWGRGTMDPEPGRCRRTDGKKWRCSRDVVAGHKYCERHMHRGRNRSRKPVEIPTPSNNTTTTSPIVGVGEGDGGCGPAVGTLTIAASPLAVVDLLRFNQSSSSSTCKTDPQNGFNNNNININNRSDGHTLRHFFDDWPRSLEEPNNASTCLSISMPGNTSDVSLKLSTGDNGEEPEGHHQHQPQPQEPQLHRAMGWATNPIGGPLAEALRSSSSTSNSSPTSVLHQHQLPRHSAPETSYVST